MERMMEQVTLRSGEAAELWKVTSPAPAWTDRILPFLSHKGEPWLGTMRGALDAGLAGLTMNCFECVVGGEIVGNITIVESLDRPVGILQHVFTPPEQRQKGIAKALMDVVCRDFTDRRGRALYLGTDNPVAARIYRGFGFRDVGDAGMMVWDAEPGFRDDYFCPRPAEPRDLIWGDWPRLAVLFAVEQGWTLRSLYFAQYGPVQYEWTFLALMGALDRGDVEAARVLATEDGAVVGLAFAWTVKNYAGGPLMVDLFAHPSFVGQAGKLLGAMDLPRTRKVQAAADNDAEGKHQALVGFGMWREATLRNQFTYGGRWYDVHLYSAPWSPGAG
jgi:GNAT superfamily N-acetyltransferase